MAMAAVPPPMPVPVPVPVPNPAASLYVGDLHPDVTEAQLFDAFSEFKSLVSVRICTDYLTGTSLCYGYANFINALDASRAIEAMNHVEMHGKLLRVMWSNRDPNARNSGIANLYVKNLSDSVDTPALREIFHEYGSILSCKVAQFENGKSKGHGFVQYETEESAIAAIEKLNGFTVGEKMIYVAKFLKRSDRILSIQDAKFTNLYVKNLDEDVTEETLHNKFSEFGKIISLVILKDDNGISRGFGFVNFENPDDARRATDVMHDSELGSKVLYVARAQKKVEREQYLRLQFEEKRKAQILKYQGSNVYVKNIDDGVNEDELRELFSNCGTITSSKLMQDAKGNNKGFGFVCFTNPDEATKAIATYQGYMLHTKPLYVAIAQRKEERQAQLQLQFQRQLMGLAGPPGAVIPGGFQSVYYPNNHPNIVPQLPSGTGMMYPPLGVRPGWRPNGLAPPIRPGFPPFFVPWMPNSLRQQRQTRSRIYGHVYRQGGGHTLSYIPHLQQPFPLATPLNDSGNMQVSEQASYASNGRMHEVNNSVGVEPAPSPPLEVGPFGSEMLSSMLAAASPDHQKRIIGDHLYPLVHQIKPELCSKITGMLLEMDNAELLLLLESSDSLASKVDEAIQVLERSKPKVSGQDSLHFLSAEVTTN